MPIIIAPTNTDLTIVKIAVDEKTKRHFESLGIVLRSLIRVLSHDGGNAIVVVKGVRLALNHELASKIFVA